VNIALVTTAGLSWNALLGGIFVILLGAVGVYAVPVRQGDSRWWGLAALLGVLATTAMFVSAEAGRTLLLEAAAFAAVALVWAGDSPRAGRAALNYLVLLVVAAVAIGSGLVLAGEGAAAPAYPVANLAVALLLIGFGLKLALVPFYFWLPAVAECAAPMTTALIVSIVDIAALAELALLRTAAPWVFDRFTALWLALALLSMFGGALLALAQRDLKRMLAFSTIDDLGYLLVGIVAGPGTGLTGAWLGAMSHALFKVLLFAAVGVAEARLGRPVTLDDRGLTARFPVSGAAFVIGALGLIGVPPLFGFAGRWRLYLAGVQLGGWPLLLMMTLATALALLYYVRAIHRVWLGPTDYVGPTTIAGGSTGNARPGTIAATSSEPRLAAAVLIGLMLAAVTLGLFPSLVTSLAR